MATDKHPKNRLCPFGSEVLDISVSWIRAAHDLPIWHDFVWCSHNLVRPAEFLSFLGLFKTSGFCLRAFGTQGLGSLGFLSRGPLAESCIMAALGSRLNGNGIGMPAEQNSFDHGGRNTASQGMVCCLGHGAKDPEALGFVPDGTNEVGLVGPYALGCHRCTR